MPFKSRCCVWSARALIYKPAVCLSPIDSVIQVYQSNQVYVYKSIVAVAKNRLATRGPQSILESRFYNVFVERFNDKYLVLIFSLQ